MWARSRRVLFFMCSRWSPVPYQGARTTPMRASTTAVRVWGARIEHSHNMKPSGGSAWSRYRYNGHVYSNDIVRGVDTFLLSDSARAGARKLPYRNPQTQISVIR